MIKRTFKGIALVTLVAGSAVPSALAMHPGDGYAGAVTPNSVSVKLGVDQSDVFTRYVANHKVTPIPYLSHGLGVDASQFGGNGVPQLSTRPDDKAGVRTSQPTSIAATRPDDKAGARTSEPTQVVSVTSPGDSFNWGDASVGFGVAGGLSLLMTIGMYISRRNGGRPLPT
jgi:hypothetical protein